MFPCASSWRCAIIAPRALDERSVLGLMVLGLTNSDDIELELLLFFSLVFVELPLSSWLVLSFYEVLCLHLYMLRLVGL